jgi:hypothetical protein
MCERELPMHSTDDPGSRQQQKMQQQRQLALKRQHEMIKTSVGAGVIAQMGPTSKAISWQSKANLTRQEVEKLQLNDPSALLRILVPPAVRNDPGIPLVSSPIMQPKPVALEAQDAALDVAATAKSNGADATSGYKQSVPPPNKPQQTTVGNCWNLQPEGKALEKGRSRKFWKPWGSARRADAMTETAVEELHIVIPVSSVHRETTSRCGSGDESAAAPEQPCADSAVDESEETAIASVPGIAEAVLEDELEGKWDYSVNHYCSVTIEGRKNVANDIDTEDSDDLEVEQKANDWKLQENQSPNQKRGRFNRFIPSIHAPKFLRTPRQEVSQVTHTEVTSFVELE